MWAGALRSESVVGSGQFNVRMTLRVLFGGSGECRIVGLLGLDIWTQVVVCKYTQLMLFASMTLSTSCLSAQVRVRCSCREWCRVSCSSKVYVWLSWANLWGCVHADKWM